MFYNSALQANNADLQAILDSVNALPDAGDDDGSYDEGYAAGKQAEYDAFWEGYLSYAKQTGIGHNLFAGAGWGANTKFPHKIDFITDGYAMFNYGGPIPKEELKKIDFTKITTNFPTFSYGNIEEVPELDTRNFDTLNYTFAYCGKLKSIDNIVLREDGSQTLNGLFGTCSALEEIRFEGVIGCNINFQKSTKLTHDSLMSILNALKDYAGSGDTYTVTLGAENLAKLTDEEKMIAVNKGWTLVGWTPTVCSACGAPLDENGYCTDMVGPGCDGFYALHCACGAPLDENGCCTDMNGPACVGWEEEEDEILNPCPNCGQEMYENELGGMTCPDCGDF